jgi:centromeric protein E
MSTEVTRVKPTDQPSAWGYKSGRIKLDLVMGKASQDFTFDGILTGSENRPVYNAVARSHVCAAMDGYNAVVFAYGQTASGKTFTLVRRMRGGAFELSALIDIAVWKRRTARYNTSCDERRVRIH